MKQPKWLAGLRVEDLRDLYWDMGWGLPRIAQKLGVAPNTVRRLMLRAGIDTRHDLNRWYRPRPWHLAVGLPTQEPDPQDPVGYWACTKSSRAGVGCLFCQEEVSSECQLDCSACPPSRILRCPCFRHGEQELKRQRLGMLTIYTLPNSPACKKLKKTLEELYLEYTEYNVALEPHRIQEMLALNGNHLRFPTILAGQRVSVGF